MLFTSMSSTLLIVLITIQLLTSVRWRGAYNGGSDAMTLVVLTGLFLTTLPLTFANPDLSVTKIGLGFIALMSIWSYFKSGFVKFRNPEWRNGLVLPRICQSPMYGASPQLNLWFRNPWSCRLSSWAVIAFDLSAIGLILFAQQPFYPTLALIFIFGGLSFHALNFWALGLNRFFWIWVCTYPALYFLPHILDGANRL